MKLLAEMLTALAGLTAIYAVILWLMRHSAWQPDKSQMVVNIIKAACAVAIASSAYVATHTDAQLNSGPPDRQVGH